MECFGVYHWRNQAESLATDIRKRLVRNFAQSIRCIYRQVFKIPFDQNDTRVIEIFRRCQVFLQKVREQCGGQTGGLTCSPLATYRSSPRPTAAAPLYFTCLLSDVCHILLTLKEPMPCLPAVRDGQPGQPAAAVGRR
jgi:hypothetical protein